MFLKQATVKILIDTVETKLCYSCFQVKISKIHNKNDKPFSSCRSKTSNGNTLNILSVHEYCSAKHKWPLKMVITRNY